MGFIMLFLTTQQHINSARNRYIRAIFTSMALSVCVYWHINYAVDDKVKYVIFSTGAAIGAGVGIKYGNKIYEKKKRRVDN